MLQRYDQQFLRDFRSPILVKTVAAAHIEEAVLPPPPPPPTFTEADLGAARDTAKKLAYAEGVEAGMAQANTEEVGRRKDLTAAANAMAEQLNMLVNHYNQLVAQQSTELSALVLAIARKVAGEALEARGVDTIVGLVKSCLPVIFGKPRVTIELNPDVLDNAREAIRPVLDLHGVESEIIFKANETLARHDVRVDWTSGQAHRSSETIWREVEALLQQVPLVPEMNQQTTTEQTNG